MRPAFALHRGRPLSANDERTGFSEDIDYENLAVHLADFIESECRKQSCGAGGVLALCGEWGSGKTSFIIKSVYELTRRPGWKEPGVFATKNCSVQCTNNRILYFDPWMFSSREELILQLIKELSEKFPEWENRELRSHLIQYGQLILDTIPDLLSIANAVATHSVPDFFQKLSSIPGRLKGFSSTKGRKADTWSTESLAKAKQELSKYLSKAEPRLVIIDNVDRLSDDEIRDVFRFIGAAMNLPNIIFLVAFDQEIVTKAVENLQHGGGERYLDKVINAYYYLPKTALWKDVDSYFSSFDGWESIEARQGYARAVAEVLGTHRSFHRICSQLNSRLFLEGKTGGVKEFLEECLREFSFEAYQHYAVFSEESSALIGFTNGTITKADALDPGSARTNESIRGEVTEYLKTCGFSHEDACVDSLIDDLLRLNNGKIETIGTGKLGWGSSTTPEIRVWTILRVIGMLQTGEAAKKKKRATSSPNRNSIDSMSISNGLTVSEEISPESENSQLLMPRTQSSKANSASSTPVDITGGAHSQYSDVISRIIRQLNLVGTTTTEHRRGSRQ